MASPTQIANMALLRIGSQVINDINATSSDAARKSKILFEDTVREVLRAHPWNCVKKSADLAQNVPAPDFGWSYSYTMPSNCLRVLKVNGHEYWENEDYWEIQERDILTDAEICQITYIEYTTDTTVFDPILTRAIATLLASYLASAISTDDQLAITLREEYDHLLKDAKRTDARESNMRKRRLYQDSAWVQARHIQPNYE